LISLTTTPTGTSSSTHPLRHVAIIMDGNNRWAKQRGLSGTAGHEMGVERVRDVLDASEKYDIDVLTLFAFSSENWNRPESEVNALMDLLGTALETQVKKLDENGVRLNLIGDLSRFSGRIQSLAANAQHATSTNTKLVFNVAINYGGRWDIACASQRLTQKVLDGELNVSDVTEDAISNELSTQGMPDPDLFIRTSGEYRISNFLLWQAAYSEFYFTDVLWPDFGEHEFTEALIKYTNRDRRFGNAIDKVSSSTPSAN
jgi:undecaprenyl diphosphate synthase